MRGRKSRILCLVLCMALLVSMAGCAGEETSAESSAEAAAGPTVTPRQGDVAEKEKIEEDPPLREDKSIYSDESEQDEVVTMYLTVRQGNEDDSTNHTWTEVNSYSTYYYADLGIPRYACEAILQVGDENGPVEGEFGYGETTPNATVMVRGQTSSKGEQKNFKIRIKDGKGTYKNMQTIPLNKMTADLLRFRNKLAFDLLQTIPQMTAIRTQFVHLYVKDETTGGSGEFEDYGLFTRMEQMNRAYLKSHGLDNHGYLYKINQIFEWYDYDPLMILDDDPDFDQEEFEYYLEVKGASDNTKLREILGMVNDYTIPIEDTVDRYFDVENLSYYLAFHILIGNKDVGARNVYIYSPLNSEKWYILSWDCDASFKLSEDELLDHSYGISWEQGITKYVGVVLYNRFLRVKKYRDAVNDAVLDLKENYLTPEIIREKVEVYRKIAWEYLHRMPDQEDRDEEDDAEFESICDMLPGEVERNYQLYLESLEKSWPFYVALPEKADGGELRLSWDASYDLDGEQITYTCILARDPAFTDIIVQETDLRVPEMYCKADLVPGRYFIRVQATNESGYTQDCFDYYTQDESINGKRYGCKAFEVDSDGQFREAEEEDL